MHRGNLHYPQTRLHKKHNALKLLIAMLALASLACNAFAGNLEPFPDPPEISQRPSSTTTPDSPGSMAPTATLIDSDQAAVSMLVDLNVRSGPGVQYDRVGFLSEGTSVAIIGIDKQTGWWKIDCPALLTVEQCWVSGGAQYVAVDNVQDVPTAVVLPTPTTIPPAVETGQGMFAFADEGRLFVAGIDLSQNPPELTSKARQVSAAAGVGQFSFSPDGHRIAYVAGTESANSLSSVNVDGGDHRTLVTSSILPLAEGSEIAQAAVLIDAIHWLPNARGLAFNTRMQNLDGPGGGSQEDLWLATLDGELLNSFPAGEGGGRFAFEPGDHVLLSRADELARADLGTKEQNILLQFEPINTASETVFYPAPQQTSAGTYLAVPAVDPWPPGAETTLWRAPVNTPAIEIGRVTDVALNQPVAWSSDGRQTAFIQQTGTGEEQALRMVTAEGDGSGAILYAGGPSLRFFGWQPGGDHFLYTGAGFYALGRPQAPPIQVLLPAGQAVTDARWLVGDTYIIILTDSTDQSWEIKSATASGQTTLLASGPGQGSPIDIWLPGE